MKVRVVSCKNPILWYNKHMGEEFIVHFIEDQAYWTRERDGVFNCLNWIHRDDCTIVEGNIETKGNE